MLQNCYWTCQNEMPKKFENLYPKEVWNKSSFLFVEVALSGANICPSESKPFPAHFQNPSPRAPIIRQALYIRVS